MQVEELSIATRPAFSLTVSFRARGKGSAGLKAVHMTLHNTKPEDAKEAFELGLSELRRLKAKQAARTDHPSQPGPVARAASA